MSKLIRRTAAVVAAVLLVTLAMEMRLAAQGSEPWIGTWTLDRGQSTFSGAVPERRTMTFEKVAAGIRHATETLQGEVTYKLQYTFQIDGKDYPADVQMPVGMVAFKRLNATTLERSGKYLGEVIETVTYQVSANGKVLTVTQNGTANGVEVTSRQVYNRK